MPIRPHYDHDSHSVIFEHRGMECRVSFEALSDNFGATKREGVDCLRAFSNNKREIMSVISNKCLLNPNEEIIIVTSEDFLKKEDKLPIRIGDK
jgi:hypothetical protein